MERHSLRIFLIAQRLTAGLGRAFNREVALCAALLHDIGLYPHASDDDVVHLELAPIRMVDAEDTPPNGNGSMLLE
jgi:HD superfamily phosphodiesterase